MPKIVVLDGACLNPGDLSWEPLEALGALTVHDRTDPDDVLSRAADAEIVLTNKTSIPAVAIEALTGLKYIGLLATGYNVVDTKAARRRGIVVTNVPSYGTASVAQMVLAHLLHFTQGVARHGRSVKEGRWSASPDFCYWDQPLHELAGLTIGIVGFGRIGSAVARIARALDMNILAYDPHWPEPMPDGVEAADLDRLFDESDVITLHCPLTPATELLVNGERLAAMKPTAFLINTSRGPLVDEHALADALNRGTIAGAGLDVLSVEPPDPDHSLFTAKNCTITPHNAWATRAARKRLLDTVVENVRAFLDGAPNNVVNG